MFITCQLIDDLSIYYLLFKLQAIKCALPWERAFPKGNARDHVKINVCCHPGVQLDTRMDSKNVFAVRSFGLANNSFQDRAEISKA